MTPDRCDRGGLHEAFAQFRRWRRSRPLWAGACTIASGLVVLFPPYASLRFGDVVVSLNTLGGMSALVIGSVLLICGVSFLARPQFRTAAAIIALILALSALVTTNLGSFLLGTLLGIAGAAFGLAWSPSATRSSGRAAGADAATSQPPPSARARTSTDVGVDE